MKSIYQMALGEQFEKLHPQVQKRFGIKSADKIASIGEGVMEEVWYGPVYTLPFLALGKWRNIMFPEEGKNVAFRIENYAYLDSFGREAVSWVRTFQFPKKACRFDATMIFSQQRQKIVDYLGTHEHLAVDIELDVAANGGLMLISGEQRFYEGLISFRFPMLFSGIASVCEWFDDDINKFRISVEVVNKTWGKLFGYRGSFAAKFIEVKDNSHIPLHVKPRREERRE